MGRGEAVRLYKKKILALLKRHRWLTVQGIVYKMGFRMLNEDLEIALQQLFREKKIRNTLNMKIRLNSRKDP